MPVKMLDMAFLADGISDNLSETPEGFLICHNVPIARTGTQEYYGREVDDQAKYHDIVTVFRPEEEVFSEETLRSFEGKPVTDDHPPEGVAPENYGIYTKGHAQNIRRQGIYIVADLLIMDPALIEKIKSKKKRQVSAGYNCDYERCKGGYKQTSIRGNHIAVVERGRAGARVSIKDSETVKKRRKPVNKKELKAAMLKAYAQDASPEELLEALALFTEDAEPPKEVTKDSDKGLVEKLLAAMTKDKKETALDAALEKRFTALEKGIAKLLKAQDSKGKDEEEEEEKEEAKKAADAISRMFDEDPEEEEEGAEDEDPDFVPKGATADEEEEEEPAKDEEPEEKEEKKEANDAAIRAIVKDLKPIMATLPKQTQKQVKDALAKRLNRGGSTNSYAKINNITKKRTSDSISMQMDAHEKAAEEGRKIMEKYNPHYKKA